MVRLEIIGDDLIAAATASVVAATAEVIDRPFIGTGDAG
jgi:hypothetical protein